MEHPPDDLLDRLETRRECYRILRTHLDELSGLLLTVEEPSHELGEKVLGNKTLLEPGEAPLRQLVARPCRELTDRVHGHLSNFHRSALLISKT